MLPSRRVKQAEDAARKLASEISVPAMTKVLQQPPSLLTRQQEGLLLNSLHTLKKLDAAVLAAGTADTVQLLDAVLRQQAAQSVGTLVVWAQQQPEQLTCTSTTARLPSHASLSAEMGVPAGVWMLGWTVLSNMFAKAMSLDKSSASFKRIVTTTTDQLERSGRSRRA
jgi:hypothetical protein